MTKNLRVAFATAMIASGCFLFNTAAHAQAVYGSIFGTVTDKSGAVVAGATVTVTDEAKGTTETATTTAGGEYTIGHLIPDTYDVKIEVAGFKGSITKGVSVLADTSPKIDVQLEVAGAGAQTITVDADSVPVLKTDRADVSTVFNQQEVSDLPVGRSELYQSAAAFAGRAVAGLVACCG